MNRDAISTGTVGTTALLAHLKAAWRHVVDVDYNILASICSEYHLQAALYSHLKSTLAPNFRIFVEPQIKIHGKKFPDMVICDSDSESMLAVLEVKYHPLVPIRKNKMVGKDLETLIEIAKSDEAKFSHKRYLGAHKPKDYVKVNKGALFVWAGIFADDDFNHAGPFCKFQELHQQIRTQKNCQFVSMQAVTRANDSARVTFGD